MSPSDVAGGRESGCAFVAALNACLSRCGLFEMWFDRLDSNN